jgi:hypothetical protein
MPMREQHIAIGIQEVRRPQFTKFGDNTADN